MQQTDLMEQFHDGAGGGMGVLHNIAAKRNPAVLLVGAITTLTQTPMH
jgi:hypothetical protein